MNSKLISILALAAVLLAGMCGFWLASGPEEPVKAVSTGNAPAKKERVKNKRPKRVASRSAKNKESEQRIDTSRKIGVRLVSQDEEDALTGPLKALLDELRAAGEAGDKAKVLKIVNMLQKSEEWPDGIPKALHLAALEELTEFGGDTASELFGYLECLDPEVREETYGALEEAVSDTRLSDFERSKLIIEFSKYVADPDTLESFFDEIGMSMRNSVAADTIIGVMKSGTAAAKIALKEAIEEVTDDETGSYDTPEKMEQWKKENPDDDDDAEEYAGDPDEDDDDDDDGDGDDD